MERSYNQFVVNTWESYDIGSAYTATKQELEKAVRRAAKAANSRLRRLEKTGNTQYAYKSAMRNLDNRKRFYENTKNKTMAQLRYEYGVLRDFISRPTSTVQGIRNIQGQRYQTAVERGFKGSQEDFEFKLEKYFTEDTERYFSSDIIYDSITTGKTDLIDKIIEEQKQEPYDNYTRGKSLVEYLRESRARDRRLRS